MSGLNQNEGSAASVGQEPSNATTRAAETVEQERTGMQLILKRRRARYFGEHRWANRADKRYRLVVHCGEMFNQPVVLRRMVTGTLNLLKDRSV